jgi:hypothetical protein
MEGGKFKMSTDAREDTFRKALRLALGEAVREEL